MLLNELLNTEIKGRVLDDNAGAYRVRAYINKRYIIFDTYCDDDDDGVWQVQFFEAEGEDPDEEVDWTTAPTGKGGELKVFAFIKDEFTKFVKKRKPNICLFSADHDGKNGGRNSRAELYKRLLNKFKVPGYKLHHDDIFGSVQFYFEKEGSHIKHTDLVDA